MLGYEPSPVTAAIHIADFSKCAFDLGMTPGEFLEHHNPMFGPGEALLQAYTTEVDCFSATSHQILLINNSSAPWTDLETTWQSVLHTATIHNPSDAECRVVNSTMLASVPFGAPDGVSETEQQTFLRTTAVSRRGYDKPHLNDAVGDLIK